MTLSVPELIRKKRNGAPLTTLEISELIARYTDGSIPDYQMSAMLMAVYFRGLGPSELDAWTDAMLHSGEVLSYPSVPGTKVDKHSTGGVGDKISLCLAPAVAALGVPIPMISGRGLGHTGGTLDKLESIPGFSVDQDVQTASKLLETHGLYLIGQTDDLAPADRKLYALRDVTGTVESVPLIASSIMSKKLAEGIDGLVLDVKVGAGAFMKTLDDALTLAHTLVGIGKGAGKAVRALLTNMESPLGATVGNALEVAEAISVMKGEGPEDVTALTVCLGAEMLCLGGAEKDLEDAKKSMTAVLSDGRALEKFAAIVEAQGGDPSVCENVDKLPTAREERVALAIDDGFVRQVDPMGVARAALAVGAGRVVKEDSVDPASGVTLLVGVGDTVEEGDPLAVLHHNGSGDDPAIGLLQGAFCIGPEAPKQQPLILDRI